MVKNVWTRRSPSGTRPRGVGEPHARRVGAVLELRGPGEDFGLLGGGGRTGRGGLQVHDRVGPFPGEGDVLGRPGRARHSGAAGVGADVPAMGAERRVGVRGVGEVVEQRGSVAGRVGGVRRIRVGVVARGGRSPDRRATDGRGDLGPVAVRRLGGGEGVVVVLVDRLPVAAVEAQLQVTGVGAGRERSGPGREADLQIAVGVGRGPGQGAEGARDVGAALHRPGAGEAVRGSRVGLEVVADLHLAQRDRVAAGVDHLEPGLGLVAAGGALPVLDLDLFAGGGRRQRGQRRAAEAGHAPRRPRPLEGAGD